MLGCFISAVVTYSHNDRPDGSCILTGLKGLKFLLFACQGLQGRPAAPRTGSWVMTGRHRVIAFLQGADGRKTLLLWANTELAR